MKTYREIIEAKGPKDYETNKKVIDIRKSKTTAEFQKKLDLIYRTDPNLVRQIQKFDGQLHKKFLKFGSPVK